jgi:hypothetical protein
MATVNSQLAADLIRLSLRWWPISHLIQFLFTFVHSVIVPRQSVDSFKESTLSAGSTRMANKFTIYTAEAITKIHTMKLAGKKSAEIARAIGSTTNSLTARMSQLGITKAKPRTEIAA